MKGGTVETRAQARARTLRERATLEGTPTENPSNRSPESPRQTTTPKPRAQKLEDLLTEEGCDAFLANPKKDPITNKPLPYGNSRFVKINDLCKEKFGKFINLTLEGITEAQCDAFIKNPKVDPLTMKPLKIFSPNYHTINDMCKSKFGKSVNANELYKELIGKNGKGVCLNLVNSARFDRSIKYFHTLTVVDPLSNSRVILRDHEELQNALNECKEQFGIILVHLPTPRNYTIHEKSYGIIVLGRNPVHNELIVLTSYNQLRKILVDWLELIHIYGNDELTKEKIKEILDVIETIFKYNYLQSGDTVQLWDGEKYITYDAYEDLKKIYEEFAFLYYGVKLKHLDLESSEPNSKNISKSISSSKKKDLPPLPKNTRAELLTEIENTCKEVIDVFTQNEFKDAKKKQLQLVVKVGAPVHGKQNCYLVTGLYNHILSAVKDKLPIRDPLNKAHTLTAAEIEEVETKIKYLDPEAPPLKRREQKKYPNIYLIFNPYTGPDGYNYYAIWEERKIGIHVQWTKFVGYLPDIDTEAADINTGTIIVRLQKLVEEGKLYDERLHRRAHINKSMEYWDLDHPNETRRKLRLMSNELRGLE